MKLINYLLNILTDLFASSTRKPTKTTSTKPKGKNKIRVSTISKKSTKKNKAISKRKKQSNKLKDTKLIVIDPGHGGADTGAVFVNPATHLPAILEKQAALETSLTLKYLLTHKYGWKIRLSRSTDIRPRYSYRTGIANRQKADAFVSIHFNSPGTYGLVYYAAEQPRPNSKRLAEILDKYLGFNKVWKSTQSRFKRLYIDDVSTSIPSVLIEVDPIDAYAGTKEYRLQKAKAIAAALNEFFTKEENGHD